MGAEGAILIVLGAQEGVAAPNFITIGVVVAVMNTAGLLAGER